MEAAQSHRRPRILVTGFSSFPGAPRNPTERLIAELERRRDELGTLGDVRLAVLDVEYRTLPEALSRLGAEVRPDIAIHFGLSGKAGGFTLERLARNAVGPLPDNAGHVPEARTICALADTFPSSLPLDEMRIALEAAGLPVDWSDDAGDYLCNYLFYHSRAGLAEGFAPPVSGFVHVPPLDDDPVADGGGGVPIAFDRLVDGALIVLATAASRWADAEPA
jgi:pyroglutamyl-peptidase